MARGTARRRVSDQEQPDGPGADHPKARQILEGARSAFLDLGYDGTSVDEIARRAGVSKPTLYAHFQDKRALFVAVMRRKCEEQQHLIFDADEDAPPEPVAVVLHRIARRYATFVHSPLAVDTYRMVVAEASRFPGLGEAFYEAGPRAGHARFRAFLEAARDRGELAIGDLDLAAAQLAELCKAGLHNRLVLHPAERASEAEILRVVDGAVATFLRAFGPSG